VTPADRPPRPQSGALQGVVVSTERLSASMVRVVVGGDGMRAFAPSEHADSYVKLVFLPPSASMAAAVSSIERPPVGMSLMYVPYR
jgi:NADPH-dependent ferric siderophore reductase